MIDQVLKNKAVVQDIVVKSKMFFAERETLCDSVVTDQTFLCSVAFSFLFHHLQYILFSNHCIATSISNYATELSIKTTSRIT